MSETNGHVEQPEAMEIAADHSPTLGAFAAALAKAQGEIEAAPKDSVNPHFKSKYADLAAIREACRIPLSKNGIAVIQLPSVDKEGVVIETKLIHASGEWMSSTLLIPVAQRTAQGFGSALTYGRRYSLAAMVGVVADEDDDGNAATHGRGDYSSNARPTPAPQGKADSLKAKLAQKSEPPASEEPPPGEPPADMQLPGQSDPNDPLAGKVRFGKTKGKPISELDEKGLSWWGTMLAEKGDPKNAAFVADIEAEYLRRKRT
jgi:hypothetical protein